MPPVDRKEQELLISRGHTKSPSETQKIAGCLLPWLPGTAAGCNGVAIAAVWMELFGNATCPADGMRGGGGGGAGGI